MGAEFDPSEFVDDDFQNARKAAATPAASAAALAAEGQRAPTREEIEAQVGQMQHKLSELKRAQQEVERERAALEETRRRQVEFTTGRQEMVDHLTRGIGLLEEAEFAARREAEQIAKTLAGLRDAVVKVKAIREESWTKDNLNQELTKANVAIENARMEWNNARLKFAVLNGAPASPDQAQGAAPAGDWTAPLREKNYAELCKLGLALTWPVALVGLLALLLLILRH
jgi:chromosome segregation ATPase